MISDRTSVELLAPAGSQESLEAAVASGADAVYLGGKQFNMRRHKQDMNFDDEALARAVSFAHAHGVRLYVTLNNLIRDDELSALEAFLRYLGKIRPDAILVQDFAVVRLVRALGLDLPMHASVMMNIHNEPAIRLLQAHGVTRVVASRELSLESLALLRERTGMELEYFIHGDMCVAESGQCIHSGVLFGKSGNRGLCLKPCRWPYRLVDEASGTEIGGPGAYKLALKDMCMYRNLPDLIQAGVTSFKIEGRMRPAPFIARLVRIYRRAIDAYLADPTGWTADEDDWRTLYESRARDFSTCSAFGRVTADDIGWDGAREPRFFSRAVEEAACGTAPAAQRPPAPMGRLAVRAADLESAMTACDHGANAVYIGGDAYRPRRPWTLDAIRRAVEYAHERGVRTVVATPRSAARRACRELEALFASLEAICPDAILVGNPGTLRLARSCTARPIQTDVSMNLFNREALTFFKEQGAEMAAASLELSLAQLQALLQDAPLPVEVIVHGAYASMLCGHDLPGLFLGRAPFAPSGESGRRLALEDETGARHSIRVDQYGRSHILFAKDLCLYPWLRELTGAASLRIEAQDYPPAWTGRLTAFYRAALDAIARGEAPPPLSEIAAGGPRPLGIGAFRFPTSS